MTLHAAAKVLEFPVVFMTGLEGNHFPHSRALYEAGQKWKRAAPVLRPALTRAREGWPHGHIALARRSMLCRRPSWPAHNRFV